MSEMRLRDDFYQTLKKELIEPTFWSDLSKKGSLIPKLKLFLIYGWDNFLKWFEKTHHRPVCVQLACFDAMLHVWTSKVFILAFTSRIA